jgi:cytidine deaminase
LPTIIGNTLRIEKFSSEVKIYTSISELDKTLQALMEEARRMAKTAYAPYSHFNVGAAILLKNGKMVSGNNQENVAYPSGLCAERVAIFYAGAQFPNDEIQSIAVSAHSRDFNFVDPSSPCGSCRQAMLEYEVKQEKAIPFYMDSANGEIYELNSIADLLPFNFKASFLKRS